MFPVRGKFSEAVVYVDQIDEGCLSQIQAMLNHPSFTNPVRIMPDTHAGKGSVIGFTMPLGNSIVPNVVGVDIGCGVLFAEFPGGSLWEWDLLELNARMREVLPFGPILQENDTYYRYFRDKLFKDATTLSNAFTNKFNSLYQTNYKSVQFDERVFEKVCKRVGEDVDRAKRSICTVGGGNHYLEWGTSYDGLWFSAHSGSRHFGLRIATYHQKLADQFIRGKRGANYQNEIQRIRKEYQGQDINTKIKELRNDSGLGGVIPKGMEYLSGPEMFDYFMDMILAQCYASVNRLAVQKAMIDIIKVEPLRTYQTVHNYINFEDMIVRKGAISSYTDEIMIIPINMEYGSLLCTGRSNPEWNYSAPHGAGRLLSRGAARKMLDLNEFKSKMKNVVSTSVNESTLDEAPGAYKSPELIMDTIVPTATVFDRIAPILNLKDSEGERD